jgi:hypothetical protein
VGKGVLALATAFLLAVAELTVQPAAAVAALASAASPASCIPAQTAMAQVTADGKTGPVAGSTPVIFVHGILSSPATWKPDTPGSLAWQTARGGTALSMRGGRHPHQQQPVLLVSVLRAPIGTALESNSAAIRALPPLPSALPVLDIAGNMDLLIGVGSVGLHVHPRDIAVTLPSATAHDTTSTPFVLSCNATVLDALDALCFHSDLMNAPSVIARVLAQIRRYQAGASSGTAGGQTPYTSTLTGFTPATPLARTWNEDGFQDSVSVTSVHLADGSLTLSCTARHSGVSSALSEGMSDACLVLPGDFIEAPSAATPGFDTPPLTGNGSYSGTLTFPVLSPGQYVLSWGCQNLDPDNPTENITCHGRDEQLDRRAVLVGLEDELPPDLPVLADL